MSHVMESITMNAPMHQPIRISAWSMMFLFLTAGSMYGQRDLTDVPVPDPEEELRSFIVADGFEVNLYAADPMLAKPIQMNFDERGRLWVASSEVYPQIKPGQEATDKIIVLDDTDGDGVADSTNVFVDGLLIPTGVVPGDGGCYVANSTELLHFSDTDGDGVADRTRRVLSGFGTEDTHHLLHTLRWGHDGMLYMNQSIYIHSHIETPYGVRHLNGGGIWQFRPETMELEIFSRGFVNSWGHHFDKWGQSFATDGAYREGINYVFPGSVFVTAVDAKRILAGLNPGSPKHCGLEIVSGSHLPDGWDGNMLTNDFRANRVCRFVVNENGAGYSSRQEVELLKTRNVAFRPIDVKMGPDGAIYVADWYNPIIQHGEVDFRDERRDHTHGRIWRITAKDRPLVERPNIAEATPEQLTQLLVRNEDWIRLHAKLQMKQRPANDMVAAIESWLESLDASSSEFDRLRLEGLWSFQTLGVVNSALLDALLVSDDHRVRAAAVRVAVAWQSYLEGFEARLEPLAVDRHPRVRLEAVRGLATLGTLEAANAVAKSLDMPMDRFLDFAIWQSMRDLAPAWLPAIQNRQPVFDGNASHLLWALTALDTPEIVYPILDLVSEADLVEHELDHALSLVASHGQSDDLRLVYDLALRILDESPERGAGILDSLQSICRSQGGKRPSGDLNAVVELVGYGDPSIQLVAVRCVGTWRIQSAQPLLIELIQDGADEALQPTLFASLAMMGNEPARDFMLTVSMEHDSVTTRLAAITALAGSHAQLAARALVENLDSFTDTTQFHNAVRAILANRDGPGALENAVAGQTIEPAIAEALMRSTRSANVGSESLLQAIRVAGSLDAKAWELTPELTERLVGLVQTEGDPNLGETIYRRADLQCLQCHAIAGSGGDVGPDLVSIGASAPVDYLIESLIDPNAKIKENFHSKTVVTLDGKTITGIPLSQTDGVLTLRLAEGDLAHIREIDVEEIVDGRSLMADGLMDELNETEMVHLVKFLSELGKVGDFSVGNRPVVRNWESLVWTADGHRRLNRTSYDTAATDDPALTWRPEYSRVAGRLPIERLASFEIHQGIDPTSFIRFEFVVDQPGLVSLQFNTVDGIEMWVDGKPTPVESLWEGDFEQGVHRVVFAVNRNERERPVDVEVRPSAESTAQVRINVTE